MNWHKHGNYTKRKSTLSKPLFGSLGKSEGRGQS
jgi:hypothetical protein